MSLAIPPPAIDPSPALAKTPRSNGLSRSASVIVTSRRPSLRLAPPATQSSARPITFALPPATSSHNYSHGLASPTTPSQERGNPFAATNAGTSPTSFLNRLSRKLSQGRTNLVRRVSKGAKSTTSPTSSQAVSVHAVDKENRGNVDRAPGLAGTSQAGAGRLSRGMRVSATTLRRSRSEGKRAPRLPAEELRMKELVTRANGYVEAKTPEGPGVTESGADRKSYAGSLVWDDTLGVCWDGREEVRPDTTFAFQRYTSDSDEIAKRAVFASTLSSFPPRPPLRPRTPELSPASKIIAEYRATHSPIAPSVRSRTLSEAGVRDNDDLDTPIAHSHALTPLALDHLTRSPSPAAPINPFEEQPAADSASLPTSPFSAGAVDTAHSFASSSASSVASGAEERFRFGSGSETSAAGFALSAPAPAGQAHLGAHARDDSATSLESMGDTPLSAVRSSTAELPRAPRAVQRFQLVDDGPVPKPREDDAASSFVGADEWQECE